MRKIQYSCILILLIWLGVVIYNLNIRYDIFCIAFLIITTAYWAFHPDCNEHPITTLVKKIAKFLGVKSVQ